MLLQCCIGFCHTSAGISQGYTYGPSFPHSSPPHILPSPLTLSQKDWMWACGHTANPHWLSSSRSNVFVCAGLPVPHPPPPRTVSTGLFTVCIPTASCIELHPYHLSRSRVYVLIHICFSFHRAFLNTLIICRYLDVLQIPVIVVLLYSFFEKIPIATNKSLTFIEYLLYAESVLRALPCLISFLSHNSPKRWMLLSN